MTTETATSPEAQDNTLSRIETALSGVEEVEPVNLDGEVVSDDAEVLPEDDDTDPIEEEGSVDPDVEDDYSLSSYLGIDDDRIIVGDDGTVEFKAIIDGESKLVPLKDLASSYQLQGHVNNKSIALENERKEFVQKQAEISKELEDRVQGVVSLSKVVENQLVKDYESIDWDRLRVESPAEWSAMRQEFAEKAQNVQQMQSLLKEEADRTQVEQAERNQQLQQEHLQGEFDKFVADNPSWTDPAVRQVEQEKIKTFLKSTYGFEDGDLNIADHRALKVIQDAQAYRNGKAAAKVKKVKTLPKFQKPGASKAQTAAAANARAAKGKRATLKDTGSVRDAASLLLDRM